MKIAMFGGSFNPPHIGHLQLARKFINKLQLDLLLLIPAYSPPHKSAYDMASPFHRLNMCRLLEKYDEKISVSDMEIKRGGKSYTVDTLSSIIGDYPDSQLFLIVGADMYMSIQGWKNAERIFSMADICTVPRNEDDAFMLEAHSKFLSRFGCRSIILKEKVMTVSSTQVRNAVKCGKAPKELILPEVLSYIRSNGLYI